MKIASVDPEVTTYTDSGTPLNTSLLYRIDAIHENASRVQGEKVPIYTLFNLWGILSAGYGYNELVAYCPKTGDPLTSFGPLDYWDEAVAWDGESLWVTKYELHQILEINPSDFSVIKSVQIPAIIISGMTWDGEYLWAVGNLSGEVYKIDPESGNIVDAFNVSGCILSGITSIGDNIWAADPYNQAIYEIDKSSGCILGGISTDYRPYGLAWDGTYLWVSSYDEDYNSVFQRIDLDTREINYGFEKDYGPHWDIAIMN